LKWGHKLEICKSHPLERLRDNRQSWRSHFKRHHKLCGAFANGLVICIMIHFMGRSGFFILFNMPLQIFRAISKQRLKFVLSLSTRPPSLSVIQYCQGVMFGRFLCARASEMS